MEEHKMDKEIIIVEINMGAQFLDNPVEIVGYYFPSDSGTWNGRYTKAGYATNFLQPNVVGGSVIEVERNGKYKEWTFCYYEGEKASDTIARIFNEFKECDILIKNRG